MMRHRFARLNLQRVITLVPDRAVVLADRTELGEWNVEQVLLNRGSRERTQRAGRQLAEHRIRHSLVQRCLISEVGRRIGRGAVVLLRKDVDVLVDLELAGTEVYISDLNLQVAGELLLNIHHILLCLWLRVGRVDVADVCANARRQPKRASGWRSDAAWEGRREGRCWGEPSGFVRATRAGGSVSRACGETRSDGSFDRVEVNDAVARAEHRPRKNLAGDTD